MRVIYLHQYFRTPAESGITRSFEMARRLVTRGHEVHMVTADSRRGRGWHETLEAGIQVHWCSVPYSNRMSYSRRLRSFAEFSWRAAKRAAQLPGDVVLATSTPLTIAIPGVFVARRKNIPMVFEVRDLWPSTPISVGALRNPLSRSAACYLERFAYRNSTRIIALSPDMKQGIVASGYPADLVTVIPNSCDLELFRVPTQAGLEFRRSLGWLGSRPLVVYTGTIGLVNGVGYLARLAATVAEKNPEVRFLVVGEGREEENVRCLANDLGVLDRNFFMLPPLPKAQMPSVLSAADLATSTVIDREALWANSANKVFDALAAGCPIAINHEGWLAELIRDTGCGIVLHHNDLDVAAAQLLTTLSDSRGLAKLQCAAQRLGEAKFDRNKLAIELEGVLNQALRPQGLTSAA